MLTNTKGFTSKYLYPKSTEGVGSVYQTVFLTYIVSRICNKPYFFYDNYIHRMGEDTSYEIFSSNFKNIFNFIISESIPLLPNSDELIITHAAREKYKDLNSLVILNCDFNDAYKIFLENFYLYRATLHPILLKKYHELCLYEPENQAFSIGDLNIAVHLRTVLPEDSWGDNDFRWADFMSKPNEAPYAEAYEFFNIDLTETKNNRSYSFHYARLINNLVDTLGAGTNKSITVHIFSRGERKIFELLESNLSTNINLKFHLDTNAADVFFWLTKADILVCAKSSFSWLASFLNRGRSVMSFPFRHILSPNCVYFSENESRINYFVLNDNNQISDSDLS